MTSMHSKRRDAARPLYPPVPVDRGILWKRRRGGKPTMSARRTLMPVRAQLRLHRPRVAHLGIDRNFLPRTFGRFDREKQRHALADL